MRDKTVTFAFVILPLLAVAFVGWLSARATYTATLQGAQFEVTRDGRWIYREGLGQKTPPAVVTTTVARPKAVARETVHDFGSMAPMTSGQFGFVIRNQGRGPLVLRKGPTSCKCIRVELSPGEISPGEEGVVRMDWDSENDVNFSHEATIYTNDPESKELHFRVTGKIREELGAAPSHVSFGNISPEGHGEATVAVYSQVWNDFDVVAGECSIEGVSWEVESIAADDPMLVNVLSAKLVKLKAEGELPQGDLSGRLRLEIQPPEGGERTSLVLPVNGYVLRRLAVYGPAINEFGVIEIGQVDQGRAQQTRLVLKLRDPHRELRVTSIATNPDFVRATVLPYGDGDRDSGMMHLEVEIPADAPRCSYLGVPCGDLRIEFDHPRIPSLELKVKFAVVGYDRKER